MNAKNSLQSWAARVALNLGVAAIAGGVLVSEVSAGNCHAPQSNRSVVVVRVRTETVEATEIPSGESTEPVASSDDSTVAELQRLLDLAQPVHAKVELCQNEMKQAVEARDAAQAEVDRLSQSTGRRIQLLNLLKTQLAQPNCVIEFAGCKYSRETVGDVVRDQLALHRSEMEELAIWKDALANRVAQIALIEVRVANWMAQEAALVRAIDVQRADAAAHSAHAAVQHEQALEQRRQQANELAQRLEEMLGLATPKPANAEDASWMIELEETLATQPDHANRK